MMRKANGRKLLVASIGVAAVTYAACDSAVANLMPEPPAPTGSGGAGGQPTSDAGDARPPIDWDVVANLVAPPPND